MGRSLGTCLPLSLELRSDWDLTVPLKLLTKCILKKNESEDEMEPQVLSVGESDGLFRVSGPTHQSFSIWPWACQPRLDEIDPCALRGWDENCQGGGRDEGQLSVSLSFPLKMCFVVIETRKSTPHGRRGEKGDARTGRSFGKFTIELTLIGEDAVRIRRR